MSEAGATPAKIEDESRSPCASPGPGSNADAVEAGAVNGQSIPIVSYLIAEPGSIAPMAAPKAPDLASLGNCSAGMLCRARQPILPCQCSNSTIVARGNNVSASRVSDAARRAGGPDLLQATLNGWLGCACCAAIGTRDLHSRFCDIRVVRCCKCGSLPLRGQAAWS